MSLELSFCSFFSLFFYLSPPCFLVRVHLCLICLISIYKIVASKHQYRDSFMDLTNCKSKEIKWNLIMVIHYWAINHFSGIELLSQLYSQIELPLKPIAMLAGNQWEANVFAPYINLFVKSSRLPPLIWITSRLGFKKISLSISHNK